MPLETPTVPISDEKSEKITANTNYRYESGQVDHDFAMWENGFTHEVPELDLRHEESFDPELWNKEELETPLQVIERIEEARPAPTRAEELKTGYNYLPDPQLRYEIARTTQALIQLREQS